MSNTSDTQLSSMNVSCRTASKLAEQKGLGSNVTYTLQLRHFYKRKKTWTLSYKPNLAQEKNYFRQKTKEDYFIKHKFSIFDNLYKDFRICVLWSITL